MHVENVVVMVRHVQTMVVMMAVVAEAMENFLYRSRYNLCHTGMLPIQHQGPRHHIYRYLDNFEPVPDRC